MKNNQIFLVFALLVVVGGGAFYGGMKYQQGKISTASGGTFANGTRGVGRGGAGMVGNRAGGFRPVNGDIISADSTSITVKLPDGSSRIVLITDKTVINKANVAAQTDLVAGEKVAVFGSTNTDGSVTAQSIQLNPIAREFQGRNASASSSISSK